MFHFLKLSTLLNCLIVLLAFLSSSPTNPAARAGLEDAGYNLFRRYIAGVVSSWDVLLFALFFFTIFNNIYTKKKSNQLWRATRNKSIMLYFIVLVLSVVIGLIIITITQSSSFYFIDWFRSVTPLFYMFCTYFIVVNIVDTDDKVLNVWKLLELIAVAMVLYGFFRIYAILNGSILTLAVGGIPIVLYSELSYFDLPIAVYLLNIWCGKKLGVSRSLLLICMIGFILASTRRYNYIQLVLNSILILFMANRSGLVTLKQALFKSRYILYILGIGTVIIILSVPELFDAVFFAIQTINVFSSEGFNYTGEFRLVQVENIFLNMLNIPITFLSGFGIGSKWHVIKELPITIDEIGSFMAYDAKVMSHGSEYLPYFHVLYFSAFFRFGAVGCLFLLYLARTLWVNTSKTIRSLPDANMQILLSGFISLSVLPLLSLGDNAAVTTYIILGINLGLIESIRLSHRNVKKQESH